MKYHLIICPFYLIQMLLGRDQLFLTNPRICRLLFLFLIVNKTYVVAEISKISSFLVDRKISYQKRCPHLPDSKDPNFLA